MRLLRRKSGLRSVARSTSYPYPIEKGGFEDIEERKQHACRDGIRGIGGKYSPKMRKTSSKTKAPFTMTNEGKNEKRGRFKKLKVIKNSFLIGCRDLEMSSPFGSEEGSKTNQPAQYLQICSSFAGLGGSVLL